MSGEKTSVLFPVEILNRELDYRVLLAVFCARPGNRIFIGQHDALFRLSRHLRRGVYVGKNIFSTARFSLPDPDISRYRAFKERGFVLVHFDEEGAIFPGDEARRRQLLQMRLNPTVLAAEDRICCWGTLQRDFYVELAPALASRAFATGHPRFDLLKEPYREYYREEVDRLRSRFGDFILINTNFTMQNNALGLCDNFSDRVQYRGEDPSFRAAYLKEFADTSTIFGSLLRLIDSLARAYPQTRIVVRPHPSEEAAFYSRVFGKVAGVTVLHEGTVHPWLLACRALIHNNCSTAVEGFFAGAEVITYLPIDDKEHEALLPNLVGTLCRGDAEVLAAVGKALRSPDRRRDQPRFEAAARRLVRNVEADAFRELSRAIASAEEAAGPGPAGLAAFRAREALRSGALAGKRLVRPLFRQKQLEYEYYTAPQNFPGFDPGDVAARIARASRVLGKAVSHRFHGPEVFSLESA